MVCDLGAHGLSRLRGDGVPESISPGGVATKPGTGDSPVGRAKAEQTPGDSQPVKAPENGRDRLKPAVSRPLSHEVWPGCSTGLFLKISEC